jgi:pimeloyl-ACP methyl ester carboxylesterase
LGFVLSLGCAGLSQRPPVIAPSCSQAIVFVADGAGDFRVTSTFLREVVAHDGCPVHVETFPWSHGYGCVLRDQIDYAHARAEGCRLAATITAYCQSHPGASVYLVGHSAGSAVVITAAEHLPPDSVQGMALLAPSLSTFYDLRPVLHAVRHLDVYYSHHDNLYLGLVIGICGTSDRMHAPASGRVGFQVHADCPEDQLLLSRLRQHCWQPTDAWTGNHGGHYGARNPGFLHARVLPMLMQ